MGYETAFKKAWEELSKLKPAKNLSVKFLADEYSIDTEEAKIISLPCNVPAKELAGILILHYLARKIKGLPGPEWEWLTFRELSGVEGYYDAFRKRCIVPIVRKYGKNPDAIKAVLGRMPARLADGGDVAIQIEAFAGVPVLIKLWKADSEFGPDANMYFDASIKNIFCIEDIIVLAGIVGAGL